MVNQKRQSIRGVARILIFAGFILIAVVGCGGSPSYPDSGPLSQVKQPHLRLQTTYPSQMLIQTSAVVRVRLVSDQDINISTIPVEKATVVSSNSEPQGTPTASLSQAFGPDYTLSLTTSLTSDAFKITSIPLNVQPQSPDQPSVEWKWSIFSQNTNDQVLDVTVFSTWQSKKDKSNVIGPFIVAEQQLLVNVTLPAPTPTPTPTHKHIIVTPVTIDIGQIISTLLPYILGTGGTGLLAFFLVKKRANSKKGKPKG